VHDRHGQRLRRQAQVAEHLTPLRSGTVEARRSGGDARAQCARSPSAGAAGVSACSPGGHHGTSSWARGFVIVDTRGRICGSSESTHWKEGS